MPDDVRQRRNQLGERDVTDIMETGGDIPAFEVTEDLQIRLWAARRRVAELIEEEEASRDTCNDIRADIATAQRIQAERYVVNAD